MWAGTAPHQYTTRIMILLSTWMFSLVEGNALVEIGKATANDGMAPRMGVPGICPEEESVNLVVDRSALGVDPRGGPSKSVASGVRAGKGSWMGPNPLVTDGTCFTLKVGSGSL